MSATIELLAKNFAGQYDLLKSTIADFSEADMMVRPTDAANHTAWQLGHLLVLHAMVCGMYNAAAAPKLPESAQKLYGKEGARSDDKGAFIQKDEALTLLAQAQAGLAAWIRTLKDEDLQKPGPEAFKGWTPTLGDLILALPQHMNMHIGQFQVIRRKLGKPVLF